MSDSVEPVVLRWRVERRLVRSPTCTWWVGAIGSDGYGRLAVRLDGVRVVTVHRWLWEQEHGQLPPGVQLRHVCDETSCVRLDHLMPGDHQLNMADMRARGRCGGRRHAGRADIRGPAGRARAIRAALRGGWDPVRLDRAIAAGEPWRAQLTLFPPPSTLTTSPAPTNRGAAGARRQIAYWPRPPSSASNDPVLAGRRWAR